MPYCASTHFPALDSETVASQGTGLDIYEHEGALLSGELLVTRDFALDGSPVVTHSHKKLRQVAWVFVTKTNRLQWPNNLLT